MYQLAASAALSIYGASQAAKAQAEQATADNIAQAEKRRLEFNRDTQAYFQNMNSAARQNTADNFNIGLATAEAQDALALAKAGSGLSGASINELDDEISRGVGADRVAAQRSLIDAQDSLNRDRLNKNENRLISANQARAQDYSKGITDAIIGSAAPFVGKGIESVVNGIAKEQKLKREKERELGDGTLNQRTSSINAYGPGAFIT